MTKGDDVCFQCLRWCDVMTIERDVSSKIWHQTQKSSTMQLSANESNKEIHVRLTSLFFNANGYETCSMLNWFVDWYE